MKINSITNLPWKKVVFSALMAGSLAVLPALRASLPSTAASNLTTVYASGGAVSTTQSTSGINDTLTVTSTAPITVLNWGNFWDGTSAGGTAGSTDTINYALPSASASILNQITGTGSVMTTLNGNISSNGKVFFLNPNGIVIGGQANITVAGFYASTLQENASYFEQNGTLQVFSSTPPVGTTTGAITATAGGVITTASIGGGGDIRMAGNGVQIGGSVSGNVFLVNIGGTTNAVETGVTSPSSINATTVGGVTAGGNLTISSNGAQVLLSDSNATTVAGNLSITTGGGTNGSVVLTNGAATSVTGSSVINTTGSTNASISGGASAFTSSGGLSLTSGTGAGTVASNGTITLGNVAVGSGVLSFTGGNTSITDSTDSATGTVTLGNSTVDGTLSLTVPGLLATQNFGSTSSTPATLTMAATSANGITLATGGKTSFAGSGALNFVALASTGAVSITTTGNISLNNTGTITIPTLSLTTTSGTITQTTAAAGNLIDATLLTVNAPTVTLANTSNVISAASLQGGTVTLVDAASTLTIAKGTNVTGNASITNIGAANDSIALGSLNTDTLTFGGNLTLALSATAATNQQLTTAAGTISVTGNTTITDSGVGSGTVSVALGSGASAVNQSYTFGGPIAITMSAGAAPVSIFGTSTLNLGAINTSTGNLEVDSNIAGTGNSGITNPAGVITVGGTLVLGSGASAAPSNIQIGGTANPAALTGTVTIGDSTATSGVTYTANNVSLTNSLATTLITGASTSVKGLTSITQTGNSGASGVTVTGNTSNLSIMDTGTTPSGNVSVTDNGGSITLTNFAIGNSTSGGNVSVTDSAGSITLGAGINDLTNGVTTLTSTGTSAGISDTANSPVNIYGEVIFNSDGAINVSNNTASSLGAIQLNATTTVATVNNSNITYTEGGTVNLDQISVPGTYTGTVSITSANANIVEDTLHNLVVPNTGKLNLTASSATGQVLLSSTTAANNQISAPVSITATGNSVIWDENALTLAGVFINTGTFTVNTTGAGSINVTEQAGTTIYTYAGDTFKTAGGTVTLGQSGNNFGPITVDTTNAGGTAGGANVSVKEYGGNNWASIATGTAGNFSATSETSIVFQTGNAVIGGSTTLAAPLGSILFTGSANNLSGGLLKVTTTGNASVTDTNASTTLADGTNVAGTLTVNNTNAGGIIKDNGTTGNITAGTAALFVTTSGAGDISLTGGNNSIANLELKAGSGTTNVNDNVAVNILPGTAVNGPATISSGGGVTMTTSGPVTFLSTLGLNASSGNITFSDTSVLFNGKVTAVAAGSTGDVNFSALSLGTNFNGVTPSVTTSNNATYYQAPGP